MRWETPEILKYKRTGTHHHDLEIFEHGMFYVLLYPPVSTTPARKIMKLCTKLGQY
jgi:hypothetical protein